MRRATGALIAKEKRRISTVGASAVDGMREQF
jgi:hypothetical protein